MRKYSSMLIQSARLEQIKPMTAFSSSLLSSLATSSLPILKKLLVVLYLLHGPFLLRKFSHFYKNTKEGHTAAKQSSCSLYMKLQLGTNILKCYMVHVYCASLAANDSNTDISPLSFLHLRDLVLGVAAACPSY